MKLFFSIISILIFAFANAAFAGVKEGGGDESISFVCQSSSNENLDLQIIGSGSDASEIQLQVFIYGILIASDSGILDISSQKYVGQIFDLALHESASITAKEPNLVLAVGASDPLICH